MMLTIALRLAEYLIRYLLEKDWSVGNKLVNAKKALEDHQKELAKCEDDQRLIQVEIDARNRTIAEIAYKLDKINELIFQMEVTYADKLKKTKEHADSLSDDDVLVHPV